MVCAVLESEQESVRRVAVNLIRDTRNNPTKSPREGVAGKVECKSH